MDVHHKCTIDFSYLTNLTELSLSYKNIIPENLQCLKKLKTLITILCPSVSAIGNAALPMLEKIILDNPSSVMDAAILVSSPKLKIVGIYDLCDAFVEQYVSCLASMKHQISIETTRRGLMQNGIAGTLIYWKNGNCETGQMFIKTSQNWHNEDMNGISSCETYSLTKQFFERFASKYYRYMFARNTCVVEVECIGDCTDDMLHGYGTLRKNGNVYSGMWEKNKPIGDFTVHFENGDRYYGEINEFYQISDSGTIITKSGTPAILNQ